MTVYLDDERVTLGAEDLASVLDAARTQLEPAGRMVVEVQVDGHTLSAAEVEQQSQAPVADAEVRLYSANPRELGVEALDQVRGRLAQVRTDMQEAADLLQQDRGVEALQQVAGCIEGWLQAQQTVQLAAQLANVDLMTLDTGSESVPAIMNRLIDGLRALKEALAHQDTVTLADALAYEWPDHVDAWDRLVETLTARIESETV